MGNAWDRAKARWANAPRKCEYRGSGEFEGWHCNRDVNADGKHSGRHYMPGKGYWGQEWRDLEDPSAPRAQYCDLDWQDRFSTEAAPEAARYYTDYSVNREVLFTVGPLGGVYIPRKHIKDVALQLRQWADAIEKVIEDYELDQPDRGKF